MPARALLVVLLLLTGCMQGTDFIPPDRPSVTAYGSADDRPLAGAQQVVPGANLPHDWWQLFEVPMLDRVIRQALANNHTLGSAMARLGQARESLVAQSGAGDPQLSLAGAGGRQKYGVSLFGPTDFHIPPFNYYQLGPNTSYLVDIFGGQRRAVEQMQALADYQQAELQAATLTLIGDVILHCLTIAATHAEQQAVDRIVADDERTLDLVRQAYAAGAAGQTEILSAQSQLAADRTLLPPLSQQLAVARHALAILVGSAPANWTVPDFTLVEFKLAARVPLTLPAELVRHRPDILAAEAELHAATAAVGIATANLYPHITLTAGAAFETLQPQNLFEPGNAAANLAASVTQTIWDGGTLEARKRGAQDALDAQSQIYQQTVIAAFAQIADSLQALANDAEQQDLQNQALETAEKSLALAQRSLAEGNSGLLPVLDAERLRNQALLGTIRAQAQRLQDDAQLLVRLGGASLVD